MDLESALAYVDTHPLSFEQSALLPILIRNKIADTLQQQQTKEAKDAKVVVAKPVENEARATLLRCVRQVAHQYNSVDEYTWSSICVSLRSLHLGNAAEWLAKTRDTHGFLFLLFGASALVVDNNKKPLCVHPYGQLEGIEKQRFDRMAVFNPNATNDEKEEAEKKKEEAEARTIVLDEYAYAWDNPFWTVAQHLDPSLSPSSWPLLLLAPTYFVYTNNALVAYYSQKKEENTLFATQFTLLVANRLLFLLESALQQHVTCSCDELEHLVAVCYQKCSQFSAPVLHNVLAHKHLSVAVDLFWFSDTVADLESRLGIFDLMLQTHQVRAFAKALQQVCISQQIPLVEIFDRLAEVFVGHNGSLDCLLGYLARDAACLDVFVYRSTIAFLRQATGLNATQQEMEQCNVGALQSRIDDCVDDDNDVLLRSFVAHRFAVDDRDEKNAIALPLLVRYAPTRTYGALLYSKSLVSACCLRKSGNGAGGGFVLPCQTAASTQKGKKQNASRYAQMLIVSPPYAGEIVTAFSPFCRLLMPVAKSSNTAPMGYAKLEYFSLEKRAWAPIDLLLQHPGGLYNRITSPRSLELRRESLRQVQSLRLPPPLPVEKMRDAHYLAYQIVQSSSDNSAESEGWTNYVHPAVAAHLVQIGIRMARDPEQQNVAAALQKERQKSLVLLESWTCNLFGGSPQETSKRGKKRKKEPVEKVD